MKKKKKTVEKTIYGAQDGCLLREMMLVFIYEVHSSCVLVALEYK